MSQQEGSLMIFTVKQSPTCFAHTENKNDFQVCFCFLKACQMSKALERVLKMSMIFKWKPFKWHVGNATACSAVLVRDGRGTPPEEQKLCSRWMLYPKFSLHLNMKGIVVALSQTLLNKNTWRSVALIRNLEMNCDTETYALGSGFFLPHKRKQCFTNSNYSLQPGERLSSYYGKRNMGERFFGLLNPIHFHNMVYGLFS